MAGKRAPKTLFVCPLLWPSGALRTRGGVPGYFFGEVTAYLTSTSTQTPQPFLTRMSFLSFQCKCSPVGDEHEPQSIC
ncbi:hypothetical protein EDB84DRAFT_451285 [Lactarius hengduanensis]|nr:hypothetical protein EDB84DRAFT_451285 [Lactarius hengduanensis]